jgi:hypothetical protein
MVCGCLLEVDEGAGKSIKLFYNLSPRGILIVGDFVRKPVGTY